MRLWHIGKMFVGTAALALSGCGGDNDARLSAPPGESFFFGRFTGTNAEEAIGAWEIVAPEIGSC